MRMYDQRAVPLFGHGDRVIGPVGVLAGVTRGLVTHTRRARGQSGARLGGLGRADSAQPDDDARDASGQCHATSHAGPGARRERSVQTWAVQSNAPELSGTSSRRPVRCYEGIGSRTIDHTVLFILCMRTHAAGAAPGEQQVIRASCGELGRHPTA